VVVTVVLVAAVVVTAVVAVVALVVVVVKAVAVTVTCLDWDSGMFEDCRTRCESLQDERSCCLSCQYLE
jgi:hypothetical protein